jgi:hypothetical protein
MSEKASAQFRVLANRSSRHLQAKRVVRAAPWSGLPVNAQGKLCLDASGTYKRWELADAQLQGLNRNPAGTVGKERKVKPIKMLGLVALAALMVMVFAGASSARAETTALCATDVSVCESPITHLHGTSVGKIVLLTNPKVECNVLFLGDTVTSLGAPLLITGAFTYSTCGSSCSVVEENGPSIIKILKEGHETASVLAALLAHVNCFGINCYYKAEELVGTYKGPLLSTQANGEILISEQVLPKEKGILCPTKTKVDVVLTPLGASYLTN